MNLLNLTKYTMFKSLMEEVKDIPTAEDVQFAQGILEEEDNG